MSGYVQALCPAEEKLELFEVRSDAEGDLGWCLGCRRVWDLADLQLVAPVSAAANDPQETGASAPVDPRRVLGQSLRRALLSGA